MRCAERESIPNRSGNLHSWKKDLITRLRMFRSTALARDCLLLATPWTCISIILLCILVDRLIVLCYNAEWEQKRDKMTTTEISRRFSPRTSNFSPAWCIFAQDSSGWSGPRIDVLQQKSHVSRRPYSPGKVALAPETVPHQRLARLRLFRHSSAAKALQLSSRAVDSWCDCTRRIPRVATVLSRHESTYL